MLHDSPATRSTRRAATAPRIARMTFLIVAAACAFSAQAGATTVSGHVTDHRSGQPVSNLQVTVWYWTTPFVRRTLGSPTTGADGSYAWSGECPVQDRACYVSISDDRYLYARTPFHHDDADVRADFVLVQAATIAGELRIDGAIPDREIEVRVSYYSEEQQSWQSPATAFLEQENGHYRIGGLPPDVPYRVCVGGLELGDTFAIEQCFNHHDRTSLSEDPLYDPVTVGEGQQRDGVDFDLSSGGGIEGTLLDGYLGGPLAHNSFSFLFYDESGALLGDTLGRTDADGRYRINGLPDGAYYLRALVIGPFVDSTQLYPGLACERDRCPPATEGQQLRIVGASSITGIDFTVHPIAVIRGRVVDAATGQGLGGVQVSALRTAATLSRDDGEYALYVRADAPPFEVFTLGSPMPFVDQLFPGIACIQQPCSVVGERFSPDLGEVIEHVDFALPAGAAISGTLYDALTGQPKLAQVNVYDESFTLVWSSFYEGAYTTPAWLPGTFYVQAIGVSDTPGGGGCAFYEARPCPEDGGDPLPVIPTPIAIGAGETRTGIDFHLSADRLFGDGFEPADRAAR